VGRYGLFDTPSVDCDSQAKNAERADDGIYILIRRVKGICDYLGLLYDIAFLEDQVYTVIR
jgi:hypothetical protein